MAWKSLGRDAVRKGDKPIEWLEREADLQKVVIKMDRDFHAHLKLAAKDKHTSESRSVRYDLSWTLVGRHQESERATRKR